MPMTNKGKKLFYRLWDVERGPHGLLTITILSAFVISPLVMTGVLHPLVVEAFFIFFIFAGVMTVRPRPAVRFFILIMAVLPMLTRVISQAMPRSGIIIADSLTEVAAVGIFALLVAKQFLVSGRTASHRIGAAIVVYLLMGILWSRLYQIAGLMAPAAFHAPESPVSLNSYLYFSFVTLATLGYGDITPVHPLVRNLAVLEAVAGQLYIAVLIARLVSTSDPKD